MGAGGIDSTGIGCLLQGFSGLGELGAVHNGVGTELVKVLGIVIWTAGHGVDLVPGIGQEVHGDGADTAGRAGDQNGAIGKPAQRVDAQCSGIARGADSSCLLCGEVCGERDGGLGVNALLRGVAAVAELAKAITEGGDQGANR